MKKHSTLKRFAVLVTVSVVLLGCDWFNFGDRYSIGHFPTSPVNLREFNSEYDDYNSTAPSFYATFPLCFSSNRNRRGADFDIVYKLMSVEFSKKSGDLDVYENTRSNLDVYIRNQNLNGAVGKINTTGNELGPCLIPIGDGFLSSGSGYRDFQQYIFLYSTDENGNQDIRLTHNIATNRYDTVYVLDYLNSDTDDFYPTLDNDTTKIFWSSNREGHFDIYSTELDRTGDLLSDLVNGGGHEIIKSAVLNSDADDKCPSITNDILVFTSNRAGGYGGFDLYYSWFENGNWSEPVNFGSAINTEYDEYRPIVRSNRWEFDNDMMIFSSNRPGGKGGFDLYFVGIERKDEMN